MVQNAIYWLDFNFSVSRRVLWGLEHATGDGVVILCMSDSSVSFSLSFDTGGQSVCQFTRLRSVYVR